MTHFVSLATTTGNGSTNMRRCPLSEALKFVLANPKDNKLDCWLLSNGYKDTAALYTREEFNFQFIDTVMLDVDNDKEKPDPDLLERFISEFSSYAYFLWESASSTLECPKFRAILPLDKRVEWVNEPEKFTKRAVLGVFSKWHDNKASWYFSPTTSKVQTFVAHGGQAFPSSRIVERIQVDKMFAQVESSQREMDARRAMLFTKGKNPGGWRNLPSVKKCLEGLKVGERDDSLNAACYAMNANNYKDRIGEFLDEVVCEESIKRKFRNKYR